MPCEVVSAGTIICGRGARTPKCNCTPDCNRDSVALCDFPTGSSKTCSLRMCRLHRTRVGLDIDYCPRHSREPAPTPQPTQLSLGDSSK
jgi:hypothetical protein